ncbi:hypothetical protein ACFPRL_35980 [Pseudoclavibacter helvolus]
MPRSSSSRTTCPPPWSRSRENSQRHLQPKLLGVTAFNPTPERAGAQMKQRHLIPGDSPCSSKSLTSSPSATLRRHRWRGWRYSCWPHTWRAPSDCGAPGAGGRSSRA